MDLPSGAIRDNILPLPYKEPSQTLSMLMDKIVDEGRRFAAVSDLNVSDMSAQAPVGTTLAILERVLKVMSAVQARIHYAMKQEFKLLAAIIRDHAPEDYSYEPEIGNRTAKKDDYDQVDVIPVSDPNAATMSQKVVQYQAVLQLSQTAPQIYDLPFLHRQMIETLGVRNAQKIVPLQDDMKPVDPVTENMNIMMGKPVKAFMMQDHDAHLQVHMMMLQDPKIMATMGQNPQAQALVAAVQAHIMEHTAYQFRAGIEKMLGAALPPMPDKDTDEGYLDPHMEVQLSQLAAQAAAKLLQKDRAEAQMQQTQQQMQDPIVQMQMQDLQIKQAEVQRKAQKDQTDAQLKAKDLELKAQKVMMDAAAKDDETELRMRELDARQQSEGMRMGADIRKHQATIDAQQRAEGLRIGADVAKTHVQMNHENLGRRVDLAKHKASLAAAANKQSNPPNRGASKTEE